MGVSYLRLPSGEPPSKRLPLRYLCATLAIPLSDLTEAEAGWFGTGVA
ncbi:MAG: hypothetical protein IJQ06_02235 [Paludibacteraceae bacterium]|nr:hypothetical protein [Paludibacteraceae bacterium]